MTQSIVFDRAVSFYDKTRADPEAVSRAVTDSIVRQAHLTHTSKILEAGIGTGRIGLPLLERGYALVGVDLSTAMMGKLQEKIIGQDYRLTLVQSDVNVFPFPDASFDCVYAVHLYHLVANWQNALAEAVRVIKPGGVMLVSYHYRNPNSPNRRIRQQLGKLVEPFGISLKRPGVSSNEELAAEFMRQGYAPREVNVIEWEKFHNLCRNIGRHRKADVFRNVGSASQSDAARHSRFARVDGKRIWRSVPGLSRRITF